jgi:serine/threonine-protein kinase
VALKTVYPQYLATSPKSLSVLKDEAKIGAKLIGHPNIVCTLDLGEYKARSTSVHFIVLEYISGPTVARWIVDISSDLDDVTNFNINLLIAWEICKALDFAHQRKILHRDIKPLNIFIADYGIVKVGDFGLSRFVEAITRTHTVYKAMSPAYSSPEQWRGEKQVLDTEIYQLGCTLYHLFTGKLPFDHAGLPALMNAHLNEKPVPPNKVVQSIPKKLSDAILSALEKKPADRIGHWELHDVIAEEIRSKYILEIDVHNSKKKLQKIAANICDLDEGDLASGPMEYTFPDFAEVLSESIQLILAGIKSIRLKREK